jgi:hypothetical protein
MKNKYIKLIVIIYIAIQTLGAIVYYAMPMEGFVQGKAGDGFRESQSREEEIWNNPQVIGQKSLEDKYNIKNYNFNYEGKDLEITFAKEHEQILIDRKTSDDNKIEVYWYSGAMYVNNIDLAYVLEGPNIQLDNNKLTIEYEKQKYSYTQFSKDIVINQFFNNKDDENKSVVGGFGSSILYIRIPKSLQVLGDEGYKYIDY